MGYKTIMCGDFNMVTDANDRYSHNTFKLSKEGKLLHDLCSETKLLDSCRSINPHGFEFTRFDSKTKTRIDRIYVSSFQGQ